MLGNNGYYRSNKDYNHTCSLVSPGYYVLGLSFIPQLRYYLFPSCVTAMSLPAFTPCSPVITLFPQLHSHTSSRDVHTLSQYIYTCIYTRFPRVFAHSDSQLNIIMNRRTRALLQLEWTIFIFPLPWVCATTTERNIWHSNPQGVQIAPR